MRVLALSSYPIEAAATRFRIAQFVGPLAEKGIELEISPFLESKNFASFNSGNALAVAAGILRPLIKRFGEVFRSGRYDALFIQREAMFFGPAIFEWLLQKAGGLPMILDLDDATYVRYVSPKYGRLGSSLKFFGKTDNLIKRSNAVVCGNRFIAEYVASLGGDPIVVPTVVDTEIFKPSDKENDIPVIGWIGTHSTFPFLQTVFPTLESLAEKHKFILKIVGSGKSDTVLKGIEVQEPEWNIGREIDDFRSFDIGLYPMAVSDSASNEWLLGKSGFKAIQYLAVGVPFVMSPIGVAAEIGVNGSTHFNAVTDKDWYNHLDRLLSNKELRRQIGKAGREHSLKHYNVAKQAEILAESFFRAAKMR